VLEEGSTFWSNMGQVSATFVGLIIVALNIYLGSIRQATNEVHLKHPLKENSSRLMTVALWSNLSLFFLPLFLSLGLILEQENPEAKVPVSILLVILLVVVLVLNISLFLSKSTKSQYALLLGELIWQRKVLRWRIVLGVWGSVILLVAVILLILIRDAHPELVFGCLKLVSLFCIVTGLSIGVFDLAAFDTDSILFVVSTKYIELALDQEKNIKEAIKNVHIVFEKWRTLAHSADLEIRMRALFTEKGLSIEEDWDRFTQSRDASKKQYEEFNKNVREVVGDEINIKSVERIISSSLITKIELAEVDEEITQLSESCEKYLNSLREKYERWAKWNSESKSQDLSKIREVN
jgi:hypothetical protein